MESKHWRETGKSIQKRQRQPTPSLNESSSIQKLIKKKESRERERERKNKHRRKWEERINGGINLRLAKFNKKERK